jgi:P4 family phage/plasmid primase-like protien
VNEQTDATAIAEIKDFMRKLFPIEEIHNYMWEHLASVLIGKAVTQTFNMYIGIGQNGKSVLMDFMSTCLGDYYAGVPLPLITDKRTKIGGLAPELLDLKGARLAVINEPSKGDQINEGMMKQLTSGLDPIQARSPYMLQSVTFIPQFKLVVCSNEFMVIKSQDHGTWRRIRVVDFMSHFTETPVDGDPEKPYQYKINTDLEVKFEEWKEVFLSLLLDIATVKLGKVADCPRVLASSNEYKNDMDYISTFIDEIVIVDPRGKIEKKELNYTFNKWFSQLYGDKGCPTVKELYARFNNKYGKTTASQPWKGIALRKEEDLHDDDDEADDEVA